MLAVAASWSLPLVAHLLGIDLLVLIVLAVAITSLLTVPGALSRTWVGLLLTAAYLMVAGVLFSVWPFGLSPVAMGGALLSGVVLGLRSPVAAPTGLALGEHRTPSSSGRASSLGSSRTGRSPASRSSSG